MRTLVIILSETTDGEITFNNIKINLIDELNADLCLCIGINKDYNYNNPFYKLAKYKFLYNKPPDFEDTCKFAFEEINKKKKNIFEKLSNINLLHNQNINVRPVNKVYKTFLDFFFGINNSIFLQEKLFNYYEDITESIVYKNNQLYFIEEHPNQLNYFKEDNVISYKKQLHWTKFLEINNDFIETMESMFYRWFLLQKLIKYDLIKKYDRFIITRGDYIYTLPHPKIELLDDYYIWVPNGEYYNGITGRHAVLSKNNIVEYLNILEFLFLESNEYYMNIINYFYWNLEQIIKFHLDKKKLLNTVKYIPYIMYITENYYNETPTIIFSDSYTNTYQFQENYYIKYQREYEISNYYKKEFDKSQLSINDFYINKLKILNKESNNFSLLNFIYKNLFIL